MFAHTVIAFFYAANNIEQVQETKPHKAAAIRPLATHNENYQN